MGRIATSLRLRLQDLAGPRDPLVPPRRLQGHVGYGDFVGIGDEYLGHLQKHAGLTKGSDVLDVGCGVGRMARPLAAYLTTGSYRGFDVNAVGVGWCQTRYAGHESFRFELVDLYNARYHPTGTQKAAEFRFPYEDASFDVVLMASVLTHLLEDEAAHYLAEARRVMRPGGRALVSFFVLDDDSRRALADGRADVAFLDPEGALAVQHDRSPEDAVAYDERWIRAHATVEGIHPGTWRGAEGLSYQDLVVLCA